MTPFVRSSSVDPFHRLVHPALRHRLCKIKMRSRRSPLALPLGLALSASNIERWSSIFSPNISEDKTDEFMHEIIVWWMLELSKRQQDIEYQFTSSALDYLCAIPQPATDLTAWHLSRMLQVASDIFALQSLGDISTSTGRLNFWDWLYREYPDLVIKTPQLFKQSLEMLPDASGFLLPKVLFATWSCREDLQFYFPVNTPDWNIRLFDWFFSENHESTLLNHAAKILSVRPYLNMEHEFSGEVFSQSSNRALSLCKENDSDIPLPLVLLVAWKSRPDLRSNFPDTAEGRIGILHWFFSQPHTRPVWRDAAVQWARRPQGEDDTGALLPLVLYVAWKFRHDLQAAFPDSPAGRTALRQWGRQANEAYLKLYLESDTIKEDFGSDTCNKIIAASVSDISHPPALNTRAGVNILGFVTSATGLGEDARMGAAAAQAVGIQTVIGNIALPNRGRDESLVSLLRETMSYDINIVFAAAPHLVSTFNSMPSAWWSDRLNIVSLAWELPHWPKDRTDHLVYADILWAPSRFVFEAMATNFKRPIVYMPLPVSLPEIPNLYERSYFNIPKDCFAFTYVFDFYSGFARKNPQAAVSAFQKAFSRSDQSVRLYLKCPPIDQIDANIATLKRSIGDDPRIILVDRLMLRTEVLGFISCCDVYVSPHRSEGFGRTIAEALLLNRPVITTAFSGNLDFTNPETAYLVDGPLIDVKDGEYPLWEYQKWCDPDVDELAFAMRRCREHPDEAALKAKTGEKLLREHFSPAAVGNQYRIFLEKYLNVAF